MSGDDDHSRVTLTLAAAAHELKNALAPLSLRLGRFAIAAKEGRPAPLDEVMQARAEVRRLSALVNELMDDARLAEGEDEAAAFSRAPFDLGALVGELCRATASAWDERRALTVVGPLPALTVDGDESRVRAVLENYLDNADKFAPAGTPVELAVAVSSGRARVSVCDHGPGIELAAQARLFTRFYRAPATARETRGFGLGLYLCRRIAQAHGGSVGVDSVPGAGATFWLELPLACV